MNTTTQQIVYNVTSQSIYLDVTEGRPSSITSVSVFPDTTGDDGTAEDCKHSDGPSIESVNTTVDAASGAAQTNPKKLAIASTSNVSLERKFLLTGSSGESEWVEPVEIVTNDYIICRGSLHNDYVNGNAFQSTRVSVGLSDSWIQDTANITDDLNPAPGYRVRWVYVVSSKTYVSDSYFDVVRYEGKHGVTSATMERFFPAWRNILPTAYRVDNGASLIDEAYQQVKFDLYGAERADEMMRDREAMDELVKNKARELILFQRFYESGAGPDQAAEARERYQYRLDSLVKVTSTVPFATGTGGSSDIISPVGIWSK